MSLKVKVTAVIELPREEYELEASMKLKDGAPAAALKQMQDHLKSEIKNLVPGGHVVTGWAFEEETV